ncbi:hypothetical protein PENSOL_c005G01007 [Penicillium solitum]|uniref:DUF6536 domain-containing protein n=1 Tax=Penicillium solitum TaxID=60172 RepID=A0A1V6RGH3_9EURO|nr:uncharacterized protein PENSOL_c005G01007 [Penicillium solitum]OQE00902.1 hypothetical protein PENSOL_c005G01007 [Penicillium solitum]
MVLDALRHDHELLLLSDNECRSQNSGQDKDAHPKRGRLRKWLSGWKFTLSLASAGCIIVLSFNFGFLFWAVARDRLKKDRGVLYEGDCDRVRHLNTGLHLLINLLSTALLGASNYGMGTFLFVDMPGALIASSPPGVSFPTSVADIFALLTGSTFSYNSTIFSTTAAYSYTVFSGHDSLGTKSQGELVLGQMNEEYTPSFERLYEAARNGSLDRLETSECINAYATTYQTRHGDLLLVTDDVNTTNHYDMVGFQSVYSPYNSWRADPPHGDPYAWLCPPDPDGSCSTYLSNIRSQAEKNNWIVYGYYGNYSVDSCFGKRLPEHCKLQYSLPLVIVVIIANFVKAAILCYMAVRMAEVPLLTTGDAIASYLSQPDRRTLGRCLVPGGRVRGICYTGKVPSRHYKAMVYEEKPKRWYSVVSYRKRKVILILWLIAIGACVFLLGLGSVSDGVEVWDAQFGSINAQAMIKGDNWPTTLIGNTITANIPQLIFSSLYFIFNGILTSMTLAAEWSRYALLRRGVRVSWNPRFAQRSSYFLSLPYWYAIPLMVVSAILHWLISQSLFVVGIEAFDLEGLRSPNADLITCGYTPVAIVSAIAVGVFMFIWLVGLGFKRFASGMYLAGSCSFAIAAACHPKYDPNMEEEDQDLDSPEGIEFMPLQWGSVPVQGLVGHCTFSKGEVNMPQSQRVYQ